MGMIWWGRQFSDELVHCKRLGKSLCFGNGVGDIVGMIHLKQKRWRRFPRRGSRRGCLPITARESVADVWSPLVFASTRPKVVCRPADLTPRAWARARAAKAEAKVEEKATPR